MISKTLYFRHGTPTRDNMKTLAWSMKQTGLISSWGKKKFAMHAGGQGTVLLSHTSAVRIGLYVSSGLKATILLENVLGNLYWNIVAQS
jgi:hypothetical protein